jgi:hypothetical protein
VNQDYKAGFKVNANVVITASRLVADDWVKEVTAKGHDGKKLLAEARAAAR